jgi:hypothetical protein
MDRSQSAGPSVRLVRLVKQEDKYPQRQVSADRSDSVYCPEQNGEATQFNGKSFPPFRFAPAGIDCYSFVH